MKIRDRIQEFRRVPARDLIAHPKNWRLHPENQSKLLAGTLREIGYADALLARQDDHGRLHLIDGHLRAETTPDQNVPVLILDLSEKEADQLLAILDPLAAMADTDAEMLQSLVADLDAQEESIQNYFDSILNTELDAVNVSTESKEPVIPELFQIVIECEDEEDQRRLFNQLQNQGRKCRLLNL